MPLDKNIFRLEHVLEAIAKIESISNPITKEKFLKDWILQDAVIRNIEVIGEAINSIDQDLKNKYSNMPWAEAKGMRNILVHEYFRVDMNEVWVTIKESIPELKNQVVEILQDLK